MRFTIALSAALYLLVFNSAFASENLATASRDAVSENPEKASRAIEVLRTAEQEGLDRLTETYRAEIDTFSNGVTPRNWQRIAEAIDKVAAQKDGYSSGLFWFRDIDSARRAASRTGRPILSLRLLGNLDEEFSCANSRFFRAILYSDPSINEFLRQNFVLHWSSERPAPKITIDFGDGRKLVRTITGNSAHYIMRSDGEIVDVLPGLYSPRKFLKELNGIQTAATDTNWRPGVYRASVLNSLMSDWRRRLADREQARPPQIDALNAPVTSNPDAIDAAPRAVTKMLTEAPLLRSMDVEGRTLEERTLAEDWKPFASDLDTSLSDSSLRLIRRQTSNLTDNEFEKLVIKLRELTAVDTVQNEFLIRTKILRRLGNSRTTDFDSFNDWLYSEVFLTPKSDKWIGLYDKDIFYAIENSGIRN